jgi:hypothetical protein
MRDEVGMGGVVYASVAVRLSRDVAEGHGELGTRFGGRKTSTDSSW